jgi:hypothetical protein
MAENYGRVSAENLLNNVMETLADSIPKSSPSTFFESNEKPSVSVTFNRLFGRQRPVHRILGGGQCMYEAVFTSLFSLLLEGFFVYCQMSWNQMFG